MNAAEETIYVRLRRDKATIFLTLQPRDSIEKIKRRLLIFHKGVELGDIRLYQTGNLVDDKSNLHDQGITCNSLLHYKLRKGPTGQWEDIPEL